MFFGRVAPHEISLSFHIHFQNNSEEQQKTKKQKNKLWNDDFLLIYGFIDTAFYGGFAIRDAPWVTCSRTL